MFILSGAEDLVPVLERDNQGNWVPQVVPPRSVDGKTYQIKRYRPRVEGLFARIERSTGDDSKDTFWRSISRDNVTTWYGKTSESRISDPDDPARIFSWLICASYDDKGNAIVYKYQHEDSRGISVSLAHEANRTAAESAGEHLPERIKYGNRTPNRDMQSGAATDPAAIADADWLFEVVFDYDDGHYADLAAGDLSGDLRFRSSISHRRTYAGA